MKEQKHWSDYPSDDPPQEGVWCAKCERWECECEEETTTLLLRYPVWDMTFSEYGERNGWEVPS